MCTNLNLLQFLCIKKYKHKIDNKIMLKTTAHNKLLEARAQNIYKALHNYITIWLIAGMLANKQTNKNGVTPVMRTSQHHHHTTNQSVPLASMHCTISDSFKISSAQMQ